MDVATELNISESYYNLIENGTRQSTLRIDTAQGLAKVLCVELSDLLEKEREKKEDL